MESLRWILLLCGLGLIAGVYFFGRRRGGAASTQQDSDVRPAERRNRPDFLISDSKDEDSFKSELEGLSRLIRDEGGDPNASAEDFAQSEADSGQDAEPGVSGTPGEDAARQPDSTLPENPDRIVVLHVRGREGNVSGARLFEAMSKAGLDLGSRKVFHRYHDSVDGPVPLFTVANMVKPGTFDVPDPSMISTPGVSLFMTLPGPMSALDIWDAMLATGNRLAELLEAELLDDAFSTMGRQRIAHIREQMREYDRATEIRAQLHSPQGLR